MIGGEILKKYLKKVGVKSYLDLQDDEKATYNEWEETLTEEVTIETITEFAVDQLEVLNKTLKDAVIQGEDRKALLTSAKIENYEALIGVIETPRQEKEALIEHIETLLDNQ